MLLVTLPGEWGEGFDQATPGDAVTRRLVTYFYVSDLQFTEVL